MIIISSIRIKNDGTGSAKGAVDYVLSNRDSTGQIREVLPEIMVGDPEKTKATDNHPKSPSKNKAESGVIAFGDNEKLDPKQYDAFLERWQELTFGEEKGTIDLSIVKHEDKGNLEFHFIVPHINQAGERFNFWQGFKPGKGEPVAHIEANNAINRVLNYEFNLHQLEPTNNKKGLSKVEIMKEKNGLADYSNKTKITDKYEQLIRENKINNRKELITQMTKDGLEITRKGDNYISIKNPSGGQNIRLKGGIYSNVSRETYNNLKGENSKEYTEKDYKKDLKTIEIYQAILQDRFFNSRKNQEQLFNQYINQYKFNLSKNQPPITQQPEQKEPQIKRHQELIISRLTPEKLLTHTLKQIENEKIHSREEMMGYLQNNGFFVEAGKPSKNTGKSTYLDITYPNGSKFRFIGSVFMEHSNWIYGKTMASGKAEQLQQYITIDEIKGREKMTQNNHTNIYRANENKKTHEDFIHSTNKELDNKAVIIPHNVGSKNIASLTDQIELGQAGNTTGLGGQAVGAGVAEAEGALQSAYSNYAQICAQYGHNSPQALQAKAQISQAQARLEQAKKMEAEQLDSQRAGYKSSEIADTTTRRKKI
ncbi:hypothetical protein CDEF62S_02382 [Castellaniella defragrans]